jgi:hypothetical protein
MQINRILENQENKMTFEIKKGAGLATRWVPPEDVY